MNGLYAVQDSWVDFPPKMISPKIRQKSLTATMFRFLNQIKNQSIKSWFFALPIKKSHTLKWFYLATKNDKTEHVQTWKLRDNTLYSKIFYEMTQQYSYILQNLSSNEVLYVNFSINYAQIENMKR